MKNDTVNTDKSYTIVCSYYGIQELIDNVNELIKQGWKPLGGVLTVMEWGRPQASFFQAMEKL